MRIRTYPAVAFGALILVSAYLGLAPSTIPTFHQSDKALHYITFFLLTCCFYWILETNRRRNLQLTIIICTITLGVGSEIVQAALPNGRNFDIFDIACNVLGSGSAVAACLWYHKRMLERKRRAKTFSLVPGEGDDDIDIDIELGEASGSQENGVVREQTLEEEVDNWDENAEDWDVEEEPDATEGAAESPAKKRNE